jgi:hypothetical protein
MTDRSEYVKGLRALADFIEATDTVGVPYEGSESEFSIFAGSRDEFLTWASVLTSKRVAVENEFRHGVKMHGLIHGFRVLVYGDPDFLDYKVVGTVEKREYDLTGLTDEATS